MGGGRTDQPAEGTGSEVGADGRDGTPAAAGGHGTVVLSRAPGGERDLLRRYDVRIDGIRIGGIRQGRTMRFEVPAGLHRLDLTIDGACSRSLNVLVEPDGTACFACAPSNRSGQIKLGGGLLPYVDLWPEPEPPAPDARSLDWITRLMAGAAMTALTAGAAFCGTLVWYLTGLAPEAREATTEGSLAVILASVVLYELFRYWRKLRLRRA
ncbi:hypothetical protein [Streptomyces sp. NPDC058872]|uniref:hypothetical protein n=1 Tax=Streptomyces sp. NPDC058872 TaxID=3346661 RepID=UPI003686582C